MKAVVTVTGKDNKGIIAKVLHIKSTYPLITGIERAVSLSTPAPLNIASNSKPSLLSSLTSSLTSFNFP